METSSFSTWLRRTLGGLGGATRRGKNAAGPTVGMRVTTLDGSVLGTIAELWRGADATDHASHEDTLGVLPPELDGKAMLYVPSTAVGHVSGQDLALSVDLAQVTARGWQYRPNWLPKGQTGNATPTGTP